MDRLVKLKLYSIYLLRFTPSLAVVYLKYTQPHVARYIPTRRSIYMRESKHASTQYTESIQNLHIIDFIFLLLLISYYSCHQALG